MLLRNWKMKGSERALPIFLLPRAFSFPFFFFFPFWPLGAREETVDEDQLKRWGGDDVRRVAGPLFPPSSRCKLLLYTWAAALRGVRATTEGGCLGVLGGGRGTWRFPLFPFFLFLGGFSYLRLKRDRNRKVRFLCLFLLSPFCAIPLFPPVADCRFGAVILLGLREKRQNQTRIRTRSSPLFFSSPPPPAFTTDISLY